MERKLFFFDVDGTLIDDTTKIVPGSAMEAIRTLKRDGHLVFLNSGRTLCFLEFQMEQFGISCAVCGCGTQVIVDGNTIFEKRIDHRRGIEIKQSLKKYGLDAVLEAQEGCDFSDRPFHNPDIMENLLDYVSAFAETEVNALDDTSYDFDKFCIQDDPLFPRREKLKGFMDSIPDFECIDRARGFYECVPRGCSKGSAVNFVRNYYGISPENTFVFGDSANDLTMFTSEAGNRILMGEHDTVLEPYATFVTKRVMDDGLAYALRKYGLI